MLKTALVLLLCALTFGGPCEGARILGVFGHVGKSHWDAFEPLTRELARRGHELTVISHFPLESPVANYTDISLKGSIAFSPTGQISVGEFQMRNVWNLWEQHNLLSSLAVESCEVIFGHPQVQELLRSNRKFDLLITELFNTDCSLAFAHHFKIPSIAMSSCTLMPWLHSRFGNPDNPAYVPNLFQEFGTEMTFWDRVQNALYNPFHLMAYEFLYNRPSEKVTRKYFGNDLPPLDELTKTTSLILVNSHFSLNGARPQVPAVVEIGGIHIPKKKPLPKDLQQFLDESEHGVIYFNMGSMIRATSFSPEKRQAFLDAFSKLPQRVLWKWEEDDMPGQSANVKTSKWLPQYDVLCHPKVRVYVGHGGLLGSIEAAHVGVPMLVLPVFGDQRGNARSLAQTGMALQLDFGRVTADELLRALRALLNEPRYAEAARRVSRAYRDRPLQPLDTAVYWTEFILRNRDNALVLRSSAVNLSWYQRSLLDVVALVVAAILTFALALRFVLVSLTGRSQAQKLKAQ